jgi:hypothetical protein
MRINVQPVFRLDNTLWFGYLTVLELQNVYNADYFVIQQVSILEIYKISCFHGGEDSYYGFLGFDTA